MKLFYLSLFIPFLLVAGCRKKEIPEGLQIAVEGMVTSSGSGQPLAFVEVEVLGFKNGPGGPIATASPGNDITDKDGYFYIKFEADGGSEYFLVTVDPSASFYVDQGSSAPINPREYNKVQLTAREKGIMQLHLEVAQNPYDTLFAIAGFGSFPQYLLKGTTIDTVLHYPYLPGVDAGTTIAVFDRAALRYRFYRDTLQTPAGGDTLRHHVFIANTADLPFN